MSEKINLNKKFYAKNQYQRVIDTDFSQLATTPTFVSPTEEESNKQIEQSINEFFDNYSLLFYDIPQTGEINSHEYIIKTSTEYIGVSSTSNDIQALIEEINILQQQNLELNQQIIELQVSSSQQNNG